MNWVIFYKDGTKLNTIRFHDSICPLEYVKNLSRKNYPIFLYDESHRYCYYYTIDYFGNLKKDNLSYFVLNQLMDKVKKNEA